jgi:transcriptional regulator with XRE-family HTH domain
MQKLTLAAWRVNAGFSQQMAAKALKISNRTLCKWENGKAFPKQPDIEKICALYNCSYDNIEFNVGA